MVQHVVIQTHSVEPYRHFEVDYEVKCVCVCAGLSFALLCPCRELPAAICE